MEPQVVIARRIAQELKPGMLVNLGIGIPTLVANYLADAGYESRRNERNTLQKISEAVAWEKNSRTSR